MTTLWYKKNIIDLTFFLMCVSTYAVPYGLFSNATFKSSPRLREWHNKTLTSFTPIASVILNDSNVSKQHFLLPRLRANCRNSPNNTYQLRISGLILILILRATEFREFGCLLEFASSFHTTRCRWWTAHLFNCLNLNHICSTWRVLPAAAVEIRGARSQLFLKGKMGRVHGSSPPPQKKGNHVVTYNREGLVQIIILSHTRQ